MSSRTVAILVDYFFFPVLHCVTRSRYYKQKVDVAKKSETVEIIFSVSVFALRCVFVTQSDSLTKLW